MSIGAHPPQPSAARGRVGRGAYWVGVAARAGGRAHGLESAVPFNERGDHVGHQGEDIGRCVHVAVHLRIGVQLDFKSAVTVTVTISVLGKGPKRSLIEGSFIATNPS